MGFENGELWVKILRWIDGGGKGIREEFETVDMIQYETIYGSLASTNRYAQRAGHQTETKCLGGRYNRI